MITLTRFALALSYIAALAGCASTLSGLDGSGEYACKAPQGVLCTSVTGVYANSVANNLPGQRMEKHLGEPATKTNSPALTVPVPSPMPLGESTALRSTPRILRLWIAPWEDSDGDLHEESLVYVVVDTGRWLIEHRRSVIRDDFMAIAPPRRIPPAASGEGSTFGREPRLPLPPNGRIPQAPGGEPSDEREPDAK